MTSRPGTPTSRRMYPSATVFSARHLQGSGAGDLADFLFASDNLLPGRDLRRPLGNKSGELAMHRSPRTNALHDLLPHIAALVEVQGPRLLGFLRQVALANVHSVRSECPKQCAATPAPRNLLARLRPPAEHPRACAPSAGATQISYETCCSSSPRTSVQSASASPRRRLRPATAASPES